MSGFTLFKKSRFTARSVALGIVVELGCRPAFQEVSDSDGLDGNVEVTSRVYVQVGEDYLVIGAWIDEATLRSWPPRSTFADAMKDLREALEEYPEEDELNKRSGEGL